MFYTIYINKPGLGVFGTITDTKDLSEVGQTFFTTESVLLIVKSTSSPISKWHSCIADCDINTEKCFS